MRRVGRKEGVGVFSAAFESSHSFSLRIMYSDALLWTVILHKHTSENPTHIFISCILVEYNYRDAASLTFVYMIWSSEVCTDS